jgi:hypothetical protein
LKAGLDGIHQSNAKQCRYIPDSKDTMERRRHVVALVAADRRGQAPKPQGGASEAPGLTSTISGETIEPPSFR